MRVGKGPKGRYVSGSGVGMSSAPEPVAVDVWLIGFSSRFMNQIGVHALTTNGVSFTRSFSSSRTERQKLVLYGSFSGASGIGFSGPIFGALDEVGVERLAETFPISFA